MKGAASPRPCMRSWARYGCLGRREAGSRSIAAREREPDPSGVALVPEGRRIYGDLTVEEGLRPGLAGRRSGGSLRASMHACTTCPGRPRTRRCSPPERCPVASSTARDRACARGRAATALARRAVAGARAEDRRHRVRHPRCDPGAGRDDPPRRATRTAHRGLRGSNVRHGERSRSVELAPTTPQTRSGWWPPTSRERSRRSAQCPDRR